MLLLMLACGPKEPPAAAADANVAVAPGTAVKPDPLERTEFVLPKPTVGTLSNGMQVYVVENHELPIIQVRAVFSAGSWADPQGREGLAGATMDMLNEGADGQSAVEISSTLRKLGSSVGTGAGLDYANVRADSLKQNLEPTLDVWADVLLHPDFPEADWERMQKQYLLDLEAAKKDPNTLSWQVLDAVLYGETYDGRQRTSESLSAITVADMEAWHAQHIGAQNGIILVGGDITLAEIQPLLEARLAELPAGEPASAPEITQHQPEQTQVYLVDKPGAAQSVVKVARFVPERTDPAYYPLYIGNSAWGGMFMARLNMNLREDKGWTYGARSYFANSQSQPVWVAGGSIVSTATLDALQEILKELDEVQGDRPLSAEEIAYAKSSRINGYPAAFETVDYLLSSTQTIWLYDLPEDWNDQYMPAIEAVTPEAAQRAFVDHVASQPLAIVIVGDVASIAPGLTEMEMPFQVVDGMGHPVETP